MNTRKLAATAARLITQRKPREAIDLLREAAFDPTCAEPRIFCVYANALTKAHRSREAVDYLKPLVAAGGLLAGNPVAHATLAKALDNAGRSAEAADYLKPLVAAGGLLAGNPVAHATLAKALDNAGRSAEAADYLKPLVAAGRLLAGDPVAHATLAKALDNAGRSAEAADYLKPLVAAGGLLAGDPVAHATLAISLINAQLPQDALSAIEKIPLAERRQSRILAYIEAKANFTLGESGAALTILRSIDQQRYTNAHTILYLACLDDSEHQLGVFKIVLGSEFKRLWEKSRQLQQSPRAVVDEERGLFRANPVWELHAQPVNSAALRELGFLSQRVRQAASYNP